jgi:hypothetical protein
LRLVLILRNQISSDYVEAFEQIIKAYSRIGESLARFEVLQKSFHQNPAFQQTLAVFYADILEFHKEAYKSVRRSCMFLNLSTPLYGSLTSCLQRGNYSSSRLGAASKADSITFYRISNAMKINLTRRQTLTT